MEILMMPMDLNHADEEQLEKYSLGRLREPEVASIEEHLLVCEHCQVRLDATDVYLQAMRGALRQAAAPSPRWAWLQLPAFRWTLAPVAAALVLAAVVGTQFMDRASDRPARVQLYAMRGGTPSQAGIARRPLELLIDARGLPALAQYHLQVVDISGRSVWEGSAASEGTNLRGIANTRLAPGSYYVRVYGADPEALREYALSIR